VNHLLNYIEKPEVKNQQEKCVYLGKLNFEFEDHHHTEMAAIADMGVRSNDPISHYVLSWKRGENPTNAQVDESVKILLKELHCHENQCVYALHKNTDNTHLHVAMNRVHPDTHKVIKPAGGFEIEALHRAIAKMEQAHGWEPQKNARYSISETGEVVRSNNQPHREQPKQKTQDKEHHIGAKSAERIGIEKVGPITQHAQTWNELHSQLADMGMAYDRKGSGAVIKVGLTYIKASSVGRHASLKAMEKRLGPFEARNPNQEVLKVDHTQPLEKKFSTWHEYNQERKEFFKEKYSLKNSQLFPLTRRSIFKIGLKKLVI